MFKKRHWDNYKTLMLLFLCLERGWMVAQPLVLSDNVTIENKSSFNYVKKVIAIPWPKVKCKSFFANPGMVKILDAATKNEVPWQLEYNGEDTIQNLLVQVSVKPKSSIRLFFKMGKHGPFKPKVYGRFVPERKGDFAWENDKIAFRMYGKELEKTPAENAYGIDVWVKRTDRLILNERYKRGEYHVDHGDGLDYYHVGFTLGAGNCMPNVGDSIYYSKNYTSYTILDSGPLRTSFQLHYSPWDVAGKMVTCTKTISLDAGAQLNRIAVAYSYDGTADLPLVVGIIKRPNPGVVLLDEQQGILGYWEPQHGEDGTTGVGCIIPSPVKETKVNGKQLLAFTSVKKDQPFVYYSGAVWNKAGSITTANQWLDYLKAQQKARVDDGIEIK